MQASVVEPGYLVTRSSSWTRARWLPTAVAMGVLLVLYACWQVLDWPAGDRKMIGDLFFFPVGLAAIWTALAASRRCRERPGLRWAWRLLAVASFAYLGGDVAQLLYELGGEMPYPSVADALYLLFYPCALGGLLCFPAGRHDRGAWVRLGMDLGLVAIGGASTVIYMVLGPTLLQNDPNPLSSAVSIAYPVGDMVLLVGVGLALLRRRASGGVSPLRFMIMGLLFFVAADLVYSNLQLNGAYSGGDPVDSLWMIAIAFFAVAGSAQARPESTVGATAVPERRRASWVPYIAVGVSFGLLVFDQRHDSMLPHAVLVISAVLSATLVSARQFLVQRALLSSQDRLAHQSLHDALTDLPNRVLLIDRAEQMLARARRDQVPIAALYVDLDGFKHINDSLGHAAGDELLQIVSARLSGVIREADTVGRLGGDEFVVLLESVALDAGPELAAERICEVLSQPIELTNMHSPALVVTASVGIALGQAGSADELLRDADFALYEAKRAGRNRWASFQSSMQTASRDRTELKMDLNRALDRGEFFLLYQPTFDLQSEALSGVEALLRWRHPERGVISPKVFIPLAEETGTIVPIGRWVLRTACEQAVAWQTRYDGFGVSVNVSARQLDQHDFVTDVAAILAAVGLDPTTLTLEITESVLMHNVADAARKLQELKQLGVRIAIDDFGTGYSSLAYLQQFPVDVLKIDRAFVAAIASSPEAKALVHTLVQLAKSMHIQTVGEGIENEIQLEHLQAERCDAGQGYLFARPLTPETIERMLIGNRLMRPHAIGADLHKSAGRAGVHHLPDAHQTAPTESRVTG